MFNVFIQVDKKEQFLTDWFYYNAEDHCLSYHSQFHWRSIQNVECKIEVVRPFICIYAKTIEE